jgi:MFS transporter, DHA2 family, multidrug resistance protein
MDPEQVTGSKWVITAVAMTAALMSMVDITIVNVALNDIRASFATPIDQIGWVSTGYMTANVVIIPMSGWLQRRFGYRRYFAASIAVFTVASALCGLSWDLPSLVVFRAIQGLGGGALIPTAQSMLFARYPKSEHGMAAALFALGAITGPLLGPTVGGYLIEWASWHWIFMVNVPIGIVLTLAALKFVQQPGFRPSAAGQSPVDVFGAVLLALGLGSMQYVLEEGNREDWFDSRVIYVLTAVAVIALITFCVHELETTHPIVDLRVFRNRSYTAGTCLNLLTGFVLFSGSYMFALFAGIVLHYEALDIGKVFLVAGCVSIVTMPLVGRIAPFIELRLLLLLGVGSIASSQYLASHLTQAAGFWDLVRPNMIRSVGLGLVYIPITVLSLSELTSSQRSNATGLLNLTRELGGSIGTAIMGMSVTDDLRRFGSYLSEQITPYNAQVHEQLREAALSIGAHTYQRELVGESFLKLRLLDQAHVLTFENGFRFTAFVMACGLAFLPMFKKVDPSTG